MLREGLIALLLAGLGSTAMASEHSDGYLTRDSGGYRHVDERWREGDHDRHYREDGDRWERPHWREHEGYRHDWDGRYEHRRYWDGRGWVYIAVPAPYYGWHWDPWAGRYCP
jgi:hypothetical protein